MRRSKLFIHLKSSLWFVPVLCVLAGAALSFGTIALDRYFDYEALPTRFVGGPDAAAYILSTVAASMVSLTALVLTITMVVVQLAMGQFSPRIVQRILRDKPSQLAIGLFVATFVHAILALREVTINGDGTGNVPGIAVVTAFVLVLAEHRSPRRVCAPHRPGTPRFGAHRARRRRDAHASRPAISGQGAGSRPPAGLSSRRESEGVRRDHGDRLRAACRGRATCGLPAGACPCPRRVRSRGRPPFPRARGVHCCGRGSIARRSDPQLGADAR